MMMSVCVCHVPDDKFDAALVDTVPVVDMNVVFWLDDVRVCVMYLMTSLTQRCLIQCPW